MLLRLPPGGNLLPLDHKLNGGERGREVNVEFNCQLGKISTGLARTLHWWHIESSSSVQVKCETPPMFYIVTVFSDCWMREVLKTSEACKG